MVARTIWKTLGIAPTRDKSEVRRAYARQLKITNPEDDPEGFKVLRAAYEQALAQLARPERGQFVPFHMEVTRDDPPETVVAPEAGAETPAMPDFLQPELLEPRPSPNVPKPKPEAQPDIEPDIAPNIEPRAPVPDAVPEIESVIEPAPEAEPQPKPEPEPEPEPVVPVQSAPDTPPPPPSPLMLLQSALARLDLVLRKPDGDPRIDGAAIVEAFNAVISSTAMDNLSIHTQVENQLAQMILSYAPRSDVLLQPGIAYFRWDLAGQQIRTSVAVTRLLQRHVAQPILKRLRTKGDVYHPAYLVLSAPPKPVTWFSRLFRPTPEAVLFLLKRIREKHPPLLLDVNPETVAVFDTYQATPHLRAWGLWSCLLALVSLVAAPVALLTLPYDLQPLTVLFLIAPVLACVALGGLYGFTWPRRLWRDARYRAPDGLGSPWAQWGWAGTGLAALVLAACPPSWPVTVLVVLLSVVTLPWAWATGEADQSPGQVPWPLRLLLSNPLLLVWWFASAWSFPVGTQVQMSVAVTACVVAPGLAKLSLHQAWSAAPRGLRLFVPAGLFVLSLAALALLIYSLMVPALKIWAFAAIAIIVLVNRAPALVTWRIRFTWRLIWIGVVLGSNGAAAAAFLFASVFLAGGVTLGWNMISMIRQVMDARGAKGSLWTRTFG